MSAKRLQFIDELRGLLIIVMVIYHATYDAVSIFSYNFNFFYKFMMPYVQPITAGLFAVVAGFCSPLSRNNTKRSLVTLAAAFSLTAITYFFMPSELIVFGVLHMLGFSMLIYELLKKILNKIHWKVGFTVCFAIFIAGYLLVYKMPIPEIIASSSIYKSGLLMLVGFPYKGFYSADYFPLFPWTFLLLCGSFLATVKDELPSFFYRSHCKILSFIGKHSLIIYLVHQPIIYAFFSLINR